MRAYWEDSAGTRQTLSELLGFIGCINYPINEAGPSTLLRLSWERFYETKTTLEISILVDQDSEHF